MEWSMSRGGSVCVAGSRAGGMAQPSPGEPRWLYDEPQILDTSATEPHIRPVDFWSDYSLLFPDPSFPGIRMLLLSAITF